jgi:hypothetical protein
MPKMTVLEMTQDILSDMDSDEVNSIGDTVESQQVGQILKTTYHEIIDGVDHWPHLATLVQLEASGDNNKPTHMRMPENLQRLNWIKYNKRKSTDTKDKYADVSYMEPEDFLSFINQRNSSDSDVTSVTDFSNVTLLIKNDKQPQYWTSFDDEYIVFDSYDSAVDDTLVTAKTQCMGPRDAVFTISDDHIPDLPAKAFSYFLAEAKSVAFNVLKQSANAKEEQKSKRQRYRLSLGKWRQGNGITYSSFGRK